MTAKNSLDSSLTDDVKVIRDILFGQQEKDFKTRIEALEKAVSLVQQENQQLREALDAETSSRQQEDRTSSEMREQAERDIFQQMRTVEEQLNSRITTEGQKRLETQAEVEQRLLERHEQAQKENERQFAALQEAHCLALSQQEELTAALVAALTAYRKQIVPQARITEENG